MKDDATHRNGFGRFTISVRKRHTNPIRSTFGVEPANRSPGRSAILYSQSFTGSKQFLREFYYHYWDGENTIPRLRPTEGNGYLNNNAEALHILADVGSHLIYGTGSTR